MTGAFVRLLSNDGPTLPDLLYLTVMELAHAIDEREYPGVHAQLMHLHSDMQRIRKELPASDLERQIRYFLDLMGDEPTS